MIEVTITAPGGVTLDTAGKYCPENVQVLPVLQEKTVTPAAAAQVVEADAGHAGLRRVTVQGARLDDGSLKAIIQRDNVSLTLPPDLTHIGPGAFREYANLTLSSLPEGVKWVDFGGFYGCSKLALTDMPSRLLSLASYAFGNCTGLTSITFHSTLTTIAANAFSGCTNLKTIRCPWPEGQVANAPWGAVNATVYYDQT